MGFERAVSSFKRHGLPEGMNLIEGNRGLYDGSDARGTHSTAELAKALQAPVLLVVNATKVTRTLAACILGCQKLDPEVWIAGVVLDQVGGSRHEAVLRQAIESICGLPVLGALPRAPGEALLPGRHLGLVTPQDHPRIRELKRNLLELVEGRLDLERIWELARQAPALEQAEGSRPSGRLEPAGKRARRLESPPHIPSEGQGLKVGYLSDSAFSFYYPENLEALAGAGAELVPLSALSAAALPADLDALYIGGGFPETHARALSANRTFLESIREAAQRGLPIYAECGGLMLLSRAIIWEGERHPMAGVLPFQVEVCPRPQAHGYVQLSIDRTNPFFPKGMHLRGHEFHHSRILLEGEPPTAFAIERGTGCYQGRDGVMVKNVLASYTHLHALATPEWASGLMGAARACWQRRSCFISP
jgi:cobyrinic acid a,c-diamide synthase